MSGSARRVETTETTGIRVPPPLYYLAGLIAGLALELAFPIDGPPAWARMAAAAAGAAGFLLTGARAAGLFKRRVTPIIPFKPTTSLVTDGPYRFTRNPMYIGMACLYVAIATATGLIWALVLLPLVLVVVDRVVIAREEPYLERLFGGEYLDYKRRVRRWL